MVGRRPARTPVGRFVSGPGVPALCALALVASVAVDARGEAGSLGDRLTQGPGWPWTQENFPTCTHLQKHLNLASLLFHIDAAIVSNCQLSSR